MLRRRQGPHTARHRKDIIPAGFTHCVFHMRPYSVLPLLLSACLLHAPFQLAQPIQVDIP